MVRLSIDDTSEKFTGDQLKPLVSKEDYIPAQTKLDFIRQGASNSQKLGKTWSLEDPKSKQLVTSLSVVVKPKRTVNVVLVLKSPERCTLGSTLAGMVNIKLLEARGIENQRVFLFGGIERFPVLFRKEVCSEVNNIRVIPIAFKFSQGYPIAT